MSPLEVMTLTAAVSKPLSDSTVKVTVLPATASEEEGVTLPPCCAEGTTL